MCKAWWRVERKHPHQAAQLSALLGPEFTPPCLAWHLRDTSRLREVSIQGPDPQGLPNLRHWQLVPVLLSHLADNAPALRRLCMWSFHPGTFILSHHMGLLHMTCALSQLEALSLGRWQWATSDVAGLGELSCLRNLKVHDLLPFCFHPDAAVPCCVSLH